MNRPRPSFGRPLVFVLNELCIFKYLKMVIFIYARYYLRRLQPRVVEADLAWRWDTCARVLTRGIRQRRPAHVGCETAIVGGWPFR